MPLAAVVSAGSEDGQLRVVDHGPGQDPRVPPGGLAAARRSDPRSASSRCRHTWWARPARAARSPGRPPWPGRWLSRRRWPPAPRPRARAPGRRQRRRGRQARAGSRPAACRPGSPPRPALTRSAASSSWRPATRSTRLPRVRASGATCARVPAPKTTRTARPSTVASQVNARRIGTSCGFVIEAPSARAAGPARTAVVACSSTLVLRRRPFPGVCASSPDGPRRPWKTRGMTYTGSVTPGGPSAVRTLDGLTVRKASVSEMDNNVYLLTCAATGAQALVDAADDAPRILALLQEGTGRLRPVVTTHQHWDHHRALAEVLAATSATQCGRRGRRRCAPGAARPEAGARRHRHLRGRHARRDPPARAHARLHRAGLDRAVRRDAPVHRRQPVPRRRRQRQQGPRRASPRCSRTSRSGSSTGTTTAPGSTPATAPTRRSAPSGRHCRSGASAAGNPRSAARRSAAHPPAAVPRPACSRRAGAGGLVAVR